MAYINGNEVFLAADISVTPDEKVCLEQFEEGKKAEYDKLWDALQKNGKRTDYQAAFSGWTEETFKPKYDIRPTRMNYMFYNNAAYKTLYIEDFVEHCKACGIVFDTSKCERFGMSLGLLLTRRMGVLDFSSMRLASQQADIWYGNGGYLQTIDELVMSELTELNSTSFQSLTGLINMTVTGVIGKNNFNVSYCTQLTHDSLMSIINALKDYSTNLLPYPYASTSHTDGNGITWTDNGDGSITVNGTAMLFDTPFWFLDGELVLSAGSYAFYLGTDNTNFAINIESTDEGADGLIASGNNTNIIRFTLDKETTLDSIFVYPLGTPSLDNVVLKPKLISTTSSGAGYTCTLGSTNLAKLTDAEKAIATEKGWTLA